ncbi:MAG: thiamine phosphate synthase [Acidobacteriales bacterium]|nr:thiamine phosphate synthase [Terriglobales bacterium]
MSLPHLYAILDADRVPSPTEFATAVASAGATLIQYRNKKDGPRVILEDARAIRAACPGITLIMNDRADLCLATGFDGVHVGQDDLSVEGARRVCPRPLIVGVSTHNLQQARAAVKTDADYIAIGPVFATGSKLDPDPVIGLEGVRSARAATRKPLVAIGGLTLDNARSVRDAGADSIAVISALIPDPRKRTEAFLRLLG